jgi:transposase
MQEKKLDRPRRKYDAEFKLDVVRMVLNGRSTREISKSMDLNENMIHRWRLEYTDSLGSAHSSSISTKTVVIPDVSGVEHERIKARLREVEQERDILKKALGIFSRGI